MTEQILKRVAAALRELNLYDEAQTVEALTADLAYMTAHAENEASIADVYRQERDALTTERDEALGKAALNEEWAADSEIANARLRRDLDAMTAERDALQARVEELAADLQFMTENRNKWHDATTVARRERDALRAVLAKAKDYHDRDHGCNGFTAEYEILHAEMDIALNGKPNNSTTPQKTAV